MWQQKKESEMPTQTQKKERESLWMKEEGALGRVAGVRVSEKSN